MSQKVQMNSLVPESINDWVEVTKEEVGIGKSDLVHLLIEYMRINFTTDQIKELTRNMLIFGERGLRVKDSTHVT